MNDIEKFKNELLALSKKATPQVDKNSGKLVVIVTTLKGIYPIKNARVTVFKGGINTREDIESLYTDQSGKTANFYLSAPPAELSLSPQSDIVPYALYNVLIHADGYRDQILLNLPVFSGVSSIQSINLIAQNPQDKNNLPIITNEQKNFDLGGKNV